MLLTLSFYEGSVAVWARMSTKTRRELILVKNKGLNVYKYVEYII